MVPAPLPPWPSAVRPSSPASATRSLCRHCSWRSHHPHHLPSLSRSTHLPCTGGPLGAESGRSPPGGSASCQHHGAENSGPQYLESVPEALPWERVPVLGGSGLEAPALPQCCTPGPGDGSKVRDWVPAAGTPASVLVLRALKPVLSAPLWTQEKSSLAPRLHGWMRARLSQALGRTQAQDGRVSVVRGWREWCWPTAVLTPDLSPPRDSRPHSRQRCGQRGRWQRVSIPGLSHFQPRCCQDLALTHS